MNPASSDDRTQVLPSTSVPNASTSATASSPVAADGVISIRPITGTGLKKCIPITRSARAEASPRVAIGIDDVLDARTTSCRVASPSRPKIARFAPGSSVAASITRSTGARPATSSTASIASEGGVAGGVVQLSLGHRAVE